MRIDKYHLHHFGVNNKPPYPYHIVLVFIACVLYAIPLFHDLFIRFDESFGGFCLIREAIP